MLHLYRVHFFPDTKQKPKLEDYDSAIDCLSKTDTDFKSAWKEIRKAFTLIRNMRNASEHPDEGKQVILTDFSMNPDGNINPPLAEIQHKDTPIGLLPVVELLDFIQDLMLNYAENTLVLIRCAILLGKKNPFGEWVAEFELKDRHHPHVRYYRAINVGGTMRILG
ncbi:MAG: hypothetical protein GY804_00735 [Alphaproteobacteria bacterium]|nr:hypothetical protein [Alphaproteobacteria bacterium]